MRMVRLFISIMVLWSLVVSERATTTSAKPQTVLFAETGFAVSDTEQALFLTEFKRYGGVDTLGYPISQPFEIDGFKYQAFQRAVLQWQTGANQAYLANMMDWLSDEGKNQVLVSLGVPAPDSGGAGIEVASVIAERESWLTDNAIAAEYRAGGGMDRYGLPASKPQQTGPFVVQRFQRYVFQHWTEEVAAMPSRGSVVGVLAGDFFVQSGIVPKSAQSRPEAGSAPLVLPVLSVVRTSASRVTAVGDSVMLAAAKDLDKSIGDIDIDAVVGRQVSPVIEILRSRRNAGQLGNIVVVHAGNNGTFTSGQFDEIMQIAEGARRIVFVNVRVPRQWEAPNNKVIADGVKRYSKTFLVDWYAESTNRPGLLWDDGVHLRPEGVKAYVDLVSATILAP